MELVTQAKLSHVRRHIQPEQDRISSLEKELFRVNQLLEQKQRYVVALELDFEHLLAQLESGQLKRAS